MGRGTQITLFLEAINFVSWDIRFGFPPVWRSIKILNLGHTHEDKTGRQGQLHSDSYAEVNHRYRS